MKINPYKRPGSTEPLHKILGDISASDWHYLNQIHPFRGWQDSIIGVLVHELVKQLKLHNVGTFYENTNNTRKFHEILRGVTFSPLDRSGPDDSNGGSTPGLRNGDTEPTSVGPKA